MSKDGRKFKFQHKIYKENEILAAEIEIYGAWLDLSLRKLTIPPKEIIATFNTLEKADNFEIIAGKIS